MNGTGGEGVEEGDMDTGRGKVHVELGTAGMCNVHANLF